jgi:hypothetical protein
VGQISGVGLTGRVGLTYDVVLIGVEVLTGGVQGIMAQD